MPVFERYFLGGITDIRGFPIQTIGPRLGSPATYNDPGFQLVRDRGIAIGGNMQLYYNLEIEFPIIESVGIKGVVFHDGGNAWNLEKQLCEPAPLIDDAAIDPCGVDPSTCAPRGASACAGSRRSGRCASSGASRSTARPYEDVVEFQFTVGNAF